MRRLPAILALLVASVAAADAAFPGYDQTPKVWGQDRARFAELLQSGERSVLRISLFGDSQETSPGGAGNVYVPNLNYRLWTRYGHVGETLVMSNTSVGGGTPKADWLWVGGMAPPGPGPSTLAASQVLPNIAPRAHHALGTAGQAYGMAALLAYDAPLTADVLLPLQPYFTGHLEGHQVAAEVLAATMPVSGGVSWKAAPRTVPIINFFAPLSGSGSLDANLSSPKYAVVPVPGPPLDFTGLPYMQIEIAGTSATAATEIVGVRYVDLDERRGAVVQSLGKGGYCTREFIQNHADSGPMLAGIAPTAAILHYGANDAANGITAAGFKGDVEELIAWIRAAMADPGFPVILCGDQWQKNLAAPLVAEYAMYPGAAWEIAGADPNVVAVNLRRIAEEAYGWGQANQSFLSDNVHLTAQAQRQLALLLVDSLFAWAAGCDSADLDGDGSVGGADLGLLLGSWGGPSSPKEPGPVACEAPGDLNADGVVDGADLGLLLIEWSGS